MAHLGRETVRHSSGTLFDRLPAGNAAPALQATGLCHAFYGSDGFPTALLELSRALLSEAVRADCRTIPAAP
ncbi:DUF6817 domain-containing protein [Nonomuraea sp. NPDC049152]|uniref:DUF6817 domain-containing protein n=1 Tax=Nonomuraea sp. NPDC049152 TaxID=3154350 RepID=UPI0034101889